MKLLGVMIGTEDSKKLGEFYEGILGPVAYQDNDWYGFDIDGGTLMIGPHSEVHGKNQDAPRLMIAIENKDVPALYRQFVDGGATSVAEPYQPDREQSPGVWLATVADIDGNYIQISTPWTE